MMVLEVYPAKLSDRPQFREIATRVDRNLRDFPLPTT
jgi:hypothetical protein